MGNLSERQRIRLSGKALEIIRNDMLCFEGEIPEMGTMFNKFFQIYCPFAEHNEEKAKDYGSTKRTDAVRNLLLYLKKKTLELLKAARAESDINNLYDGNVGWYMRSVIEQYASRHFLDRERAYFKETVAKIQSAVRHHERLKVEVGKRKFTFRPYKRPDNDGIFSDKLSSFNYLVGFSMEEGKKEAIASCRISRITSIEYTAGDGSINDDDQEKIEGRIASSGVSFLLDEAVRVVVKLTPNGRNLYASQTHNRPVYDDKSGDEYVFRCTETQAEAYFFKFGADAEVMEPLSLRKKFGDKYSTAMRKYAGMVESAAKPAD